MPPPPPASPPPSNARYQRHPSDIPHPRRSSPPNHHLLTRIRSSPPPTLSSLALPPLSSAVPLSPRPQHHHRGRPSSPTMSREHPHHPHHHLPIGHHSGPGASGPPPPPPQSLGGPAVNPAGSNANPSASASSAHHHHHHHHHHHLGQPQAHGHHPHPSHSHPHPSMGPGVPPPPPQQQSPLPLPPHPQAPGASAGASASGSGRGQQHHHGHAHGHTHTRTHSGANGFPPGAAAAESQRGRDRGERDRERGGRERGMSTSSLAAGPAPSSGASTLSMMSTSTVGPGVAGPMERERERDLRRERERDIQIQRDRERQQQSQITFQHHQGPGPRDRERDREMRDVSMHPPPTQQHRERERDVRELRERDLRERERDIQMLHHHHAAHPHPHSQAPTPTPTSGLAAVAAAADMISSIPGGIGPAVPTSHAHGHSHVHPHAAGQSVPPPPPAGPAIVSGPGMPGIAPPTPMQANGVVNGSANGMLDSNGGRVANGMPAGAVMDVNGVGVRRPGPGMGGMLGVGTRLGESMDVIRAEYDGLVSELGAVRVAKDEYEGKVQSQVNELGAIRKALYDLETSHGRVRESFEQEIGKLKQELRIAKQQQAEIQQREQRERELQQAHPPPSQAPLGPLAQRAPLPEHALPPSHVHPAQHIQLGGPGQPPQMGPPGPSGTLSGRTTPSVGGRRERESPRMHGDRDGQSVFYRPGPRVEERGERGGREERLRDRNEERLREERQRDRERDERPRDRHEERMRLERMQERERDRERDSREAKRSRVGSISGSGAVTPGLGPLPVRGPAPSSRPPTQEGMYNPHHPHRPSISQQGPPPMQHGPPLVPTPRFPPVPGTVNTGGVAVEHTQQQREGHAEVQGGDMEVDADEPRVLDWLSGLRGEGGEIIPFPGMMDSLNTPQVLKKEGEDWFALYNPRSAVRAGGAIKKSVDVSLVHNLMHESVVCCVKFSADGKFLATGSNRSAQIYNTQSGVKICTLVDEGAVTGKQGDLYIRSVCFSPCGRWLATGAEDKVVRIWDISKQKIRSVFDGHQQEIYALEFSLDGRLLVSGSGDKTARVWDVTTILGGPENGNASTPLVDGTRPTVLTIEDSPTDKMPELDVNGDEDTSLGEGETKVENGDEEGMDVEGGGAPDENGAVPETQSDPGITSIAVSPDGRYIAAGSLDNVIRLWDLRPPSTSPGPSSAPSTSSSPSPPKMIERLKGHKDSVYSVSFTRDGRFLVSASLDKGVRVWDVGHLGIVPAPGSPSSELGPAASLPPSAPGVIKKTRCVTQFVGHRDFVLSVAVSHDGKWVVSGSKDRGVMWWELKAADTEEKGVERLSGKDREAVCVLQGHKNSVISIDLSPVGNMLATGSGDWQARIWTYKTE